MSELSASSNKRPLSGISFTRPDSPLGRSNDSFVESQQCSADPSAFLGFHVPEEVAVEPSDAQEKKKNQTLKLVLDFEATPGDVTRGGDGLNPFNELFAGDTQDDETVMMAQAPMKQKSPEKGKEGEDSLPGASVYSEYSEDLAPRIFETTTRNPSVNEEKVDKAQFDDDRDRETDYEDEVECTQQLEDEGEADMTSYEGEGETEAFPESDAGTLPLGPDSTFMDAYDDFDGANNIQNVFAGAKEQHAE
ncbi:hypothetical protein PHMEG_0002331 [Phytophthora megakarya]|uniref:Uncharacterized protein n=1 Tax=Phytophthora megakarya TaxID=4795 RepID=A0A225X0M8_9STRA|nr:hypothetical protein PHMEG_0002331 [Phytophthora megakarya]